MEDAIQPKKHAQNPGGFSMGPVFKIRSGAPGAMVRFTVVASTAICMLVGCNRAPKPEIVYRDRMGCGVCVLNMRMVMKYALADENAFVETAPTRKYARRLLEYLKATHIDLRKDLEGAEKDGLIVEVKSMDRYGNLYQFHCIDKGIDCGAEFLDLKPPKTKFNTAK